MKFNILSILLILLGILFCGCNREESKCSFIENYSKKIKTKDIDSACQYATNYNLHSIPLFIVISDTLPSDRMTKFHYVSSIKNQSSDELVVLFIGGLKTFDIIYSKNMKVDSLLRNRHEFANFVHGQLKKHESNLELTNIYKRFGQIFPNRTID